MSTPTPDTKLEELVFELLQAAGGGGFTGVFASAPDIKVTIAGTRVQGASQACSGVIITASPSNGGNVYIGGSGVTNASGTQIGISLVPGGMTSTLIKCSNVNQIYVNADNANDRVGVTYI